MAENYITKQEARGTINISEDVISVMVSAAVLEVEGVAGFGSANTSELIDLFGRKNTKGLKVRFVDEKITIDVMINVKLGGSVTDIALSVQEAVCREVESVTGMSVGANVHVTGVSFDK